MAWGSASGTKRGVDDIIVKLNENTTAETLWVPTVRNLADSLPKFCDALAGNTSLLELLCSGHALDVPAARIFASAISANTSLKSLSLGSVSLGDEALAALLHEWANTTLRSLNLEFKGLSAASGLSLSNALARGPLSCGIVSLNLSRNELGAEGIAALAAGVLACPQMTSLNLEDTEIDSTCTQALFDALAKCPLEELVVSHNPKLGSAAAMHLAQALRAAVQQEESAPVARMSLTKLWIEDCGIGDEGFVHLLGAVDGERLALSKLKDFHLGTNEITCSALESTFGSNDANAGVLMAMLPSLAILRLSHNKISNTGAKILGRALGVEKLPQDEESAAVSVAMHLDLGSNTIGTTATTEEDQEVNDDNSQELEAVLRSLLAAGVIDNLQLLGNTLGDAVAVAVPIVLEGDKALSTLSVGGAGMTDDGLATLLGAFHDVNRNSLRVLELGGNSFGNLAEAALELLEEANPALDVARDKKTEATANEPDGEVPIEVVPPSSS